ncbi:MAG: tyrosine-type recombinase/integrase family protein [Clostridia bacterium]|nr:tyrosine-type recombinase/integrase family protein [Clostridia bacterium]
MLLLNEDAKHSYVEPNEEQDFQPSKNLAEAAFLDFTDKEINKMPKFFRNKFKLKGGKIAHIREKNGSYEIRYRHDGFNISASAKTVEEAKERFIQKLCNAKTETLNDRTYFGQFAMQWLNVVKKPQIKENTYENYLWTLQKYVFPRFGKMRLRDIKPLDVQKLFNALDEKGIKRGSENTYVILKPIFDFALAEDLITKSPMALIRKPKYEKKKATPLTIAEESALIDSCLASENECRYAFIFMLYTGIRRSELETVKIEKEWITVVTAKTRKGESQRIRRIPISPMLQPFMPFMKNGALKIDKEKLTKTFHKFLSNHHLHELRHTFITRCQECGISRELTSLWAGHKADNTITSNVYTHFSEEYQLGEIKKLRY